VLQGVAAFFTFAEGTFVGPAPNNGTASGLQQHHHHNCAAAQLWPVGTTYLVMEKIATNLTIYIYIASRYSHAVEGKAALGLAIGIPNGNLLRTVRQVAAL